MPPVGPRNEARKRAADAYKLRCAGRTWDEIARATGFKNHSSAVHAVKSHIARMPAEDQELARAFSAGTYRLVVAQLFEVASRAREVGKPHTAVQALQAAADAQAKHDQLVGLNVPVTQKVELSVTAAAILDRAEAELLAIAQAQQPAVAVGFDAGVIDAEVVER